MKILTLLIAISLSSAAYAIPEAPFNALETDVAQFNKGIEFQSEYDFEGIVKLSNCSGSLVRFAGQPDTANAFVLTNGHCIEKAGGFMKPGEVIVDKKIARSMKVADKNKKFKAITSTRIVYATMTGTDAALYELKETYKDLAGINALEIDVRRPGVSQEIEIISGFWERGYSCQIDGFVFQIRESDWTWNDSIRYSSVGCKTISGTSGSPILAKGTRTVVGINNTGNENGQRCTMDNPCEVTEDGKVSFTKGTSYGQQTYLINSCLTPDFRIDLAVAGCKLPKP